MRVVSKFLVSDDGAITVDWVVLTAATVGLGLGSAVIVRGGVGALGTDVSNALSAASVTALGELGAGGTDVASYLFHSYSYVNSPSYLASQRATFAQYSDERLVSDWLSYTAMVETFLSRDDTGNAGTMLDHSYLLLEAMQNRGLDGSDDRASDLNDLLDAYDAATG